LTAPMSSVVNVRSASVRLETLPEWELVFALACLTLGLLLPFGFYALDEQEHVIATCEVLVNTTRGLLLVDDDYLGSDDQALSDDDRFHVDDDHVTVRGAQRCLNEGLWRLGLSAGLLSVTVWWVWEALFRPSCQGDRGAAALGAGAAGGTSGATVATLLGPGAAPALPQHVLVKRRLRLQHAAVLLMLFGQILLEDPLSAWAVWHDHNYQRYTYGGQLQAPQVVGCACMTLAVLLLVDHCARAVKGRRQPAPTKLLLLATCSLWPVAFYEVYGPQERLQAFWGLLGMGSDAARGKVVLLCLLFCGASFAYSLRLMWRAFRNVRSASYMAHR